MDQASWRELGIPEDFAAKQLRILEAYRRMGVVESWTCTPYVLGRMPRAGEHLAWAESSAVVIANSMAAARTNREGGPSALAAAVTGWTPNYGLHLDAGRKASMVVEVESPLEGYEYGLLGYHVGGLVGHGIPYFRGIAPRPDEAKALAATLGAAGECAMFHIEGITPEWREAEVVGLERISVTRREIGDAKDRLTSTEEVDLIVFGSPQLSPEELGEVARLMEEFRPRKQVLVFTSRWAAEAATEAVQAIRRSGGKVLLDTCPEVTPLELLSSATGSPSGKAAIYLPTLCKQKVLLADPRELLRRAS
jgi:hypothetical protein